MTKLIVITGVSKGLGLGMTEKFIELGHRVLGCARSASEVEKLNQKFAAPHNFTAVDVADERQVKAWAAKLLANYSAPDLLINNAAAMNHPAPLWQVDRAEFDQLIDVNIKGVANVIRHFVPGMISRQNGIIVNFSSTWGRSTSPQVAPYCASKWAIEGLTRALAQELPAGMAAIPLNPGIIHTDMLETCFGDHAAAYMPVKDWAEKAVPFLLGLSPKDNGSPLTVPA
ncbi:MAG: SDR family oxidoreductase [Hormoscilla sp.]